MIRLSDIKPNPNNPRVIRDEKFNKLKNSIEQFPKMMSLRPMVVDSDNVVLGGNMRLRALQDLGFKEIPDTWVKRAEELTEDEKRRFIIADNVGFGDWDWDAITSDWDADEVQEWGLDMPNWSLGVEQNLMTEDDLNLNEEFDPMGISKDVQRVVFIFDGKDEAESYLKKLNVAYNKGNMAWQVNLSTRYI